jgi:hypothetical protein
MLKGNVFITKKCKISVFMEVKIHVVAFWVMTPFILVGGQLPSLGFR